MMSSTSLAAFSGGSPPVLSTHATQLSCAAAYPLPGYCTPHRRVAIGCRQPRIALDGGLDTVPVVLDLPQDGLQGVDLPTSVPKTSPFVHRVSPAGSRRRAKVATPAEKRAIRHPHRLTRSPKRPFIFPVYLEPS
jgi:hypothetical protein